MGPKIDRKALKSITVKAGQIVAFEVPVEGEPPPTCTWFKGPQELKHGGRFKIENPDYNTKFQMRQTERGDTGTYRIKAVNENGSDEATVQVTVVDKPSAPEGPLEAKDIYADHMTLNWKPPLDDGGLPIDHYEVEKFDPTVARWVPAGKTLDGKTTELKVDGLQSGQEYKFRVKAVNAEGESQPLETDKAILAKNPYDTPGKPSKPEITDWDRDRVDLKWNPPTSVCHLVFFPFHISNSYSRHEQFQKYFSLFL